MPVDAGLVGVSLAGPCRSPSPGRRASRRAARRTSTPRRYILFAFADVLAAGIASEDRRVIDLTLLALNNLTMLYEPAIQRVQANPWKSSRHIAAVPGLKQFLIAHWLAHAEGRDHEVPMTDIARPDWFGPFPETVMENGVRVETPAEFKDTRWSIRVHSSQWDFIPLVLATH